MKRKKLLGWSLIALSLAVVAGYFVKQWFYWEVLDLALIVICAVSGRYLLKH